MIANKFNDNISFRHLNRKYFIEFSVKCKHVTFN